MKWGIHASKAESKVTKLLNKAVGNKGFYILLVLAALVLLSGAADKWGR